MNTKAAILFFTVLFFYSCTSASLGKNLPPVQLQRSVEDEGINEHSSSTNGNANGIAHHSKFGHGAAGRGAAGRGAHGGEAASGGGMAAGHESGSSHTPGGGAVIPLYAAGAAHGHNNQRRHHNAGNSQKSCLGLPTLGAAIASLLLVHITLVY